MCGWNKDGQLGLSSQDVDATTFHPLANFPYKVTKVSCGWSHTLALSESGEVFAWGSNAFGQLGDPRVLKESRCPARLTPEVSGEREERERESQTDRALIFATDSMELMCIGLTGTVDIVLIKGTSSLHVMKLNGQETL